MTDTKILDDVVTNLLAEVVIVASAPYDAQTVQYLNFLISTVTSVETFKKSLDPVSAPAPA